MQKHIPLAGAVLAVALAPTALTQGEPPRPTRPAARLVAPAPQQGKSQEELKKLRAEKLAKPVFQNAAWHFDYDEARAEAVETGKLVLTYFTRSYDP